MKSHWLLFLIGVMLLAVGCGGETDPGLPPGPAMVMFYTDG